MLFITRENKIGFTLVELLIVSVLFVVIMLAVYSVIRSTLNIWYRLNLTSKLENLDILLDKFNFDLRNSFKFRGISFAGDKERLEFPCLVNSPRMKKITVGKVIYEFNPAEKKINKYQLDYSGIYRADTPNLVFSLGEVKKAEFQYYLFNREKKAFLWQNEFKEDDILGAIRLRIEFLDEEFLSTVDIPYVQE